MISFTHRQETLCRFQCSAAALVSCVITLPLVPIVAHAQTYTLTPLGPVGNVGPLTSGITLDSQGNLYGAGETGVYKMAAGTHAVTTVASVSGDVLGDVAIDKNGDIFGATQEGGTNGRGSVFEIAAGTNTATTLVSFNGTDGSNLEGGVIIDSSGNIYGTAAFGGSGSAGTVFEIAAGTNTLTTLANSSGSSGLNSIIMDGQGDIFGTITSGSPTNEGNVFEIVAGTNTMTRLASFPSSVNGNVNTGFYPVGNLVLDGNGNLFGTAEDGGTSAGDGTIFEVNIASKTVKNVYEFASNTSGAVPQSGLVMGSNGNLFGTTSLYGGTNGTGDGTVFEFSAATDSLTTIANFNGTNGSTPVSNLTFGSNGVLYGTTTNGKSNVFEMSPTGTASASEPSAAAFLLPTMIPLLFKKRGGRSLFDTLNWMR